MTIDSGLRAVWPLAGAFHHGTARFVHNALTAQEDKLPEPAKELPLAPFVRLPPPSRPPLLLADALRRRVSCRCFTDRALSHQLLSDVLFAGYGHTGISRLGAIDFHDRTVPSGGGLYPLELYVLARRVEGLDPGIWHYTPVHHGLEQVREGAVPSALLAYLFMGQEHVADASAIVVTTAMPARLMEKYGDRGYRYMLLEAGHVAQNMMLMAAALDLGGCGFGGFFDLELATLLMLDYDREFPIYALSLGHPAAADRDSMRGLGGEAQPLSLSET